ncbi:hypothetical protein GGQ17_001244 [Salinibacter ruber]|nr:hypothetical protein [Salinibacter ruber]
MCALVRLSWRQSEGRDELFQTIYSSFIIGALSQSITSHVRLRPSVHLG